ncbi:MAG TPA: cyclodeaminase/cyclohydrolase family protein [Solirubrobacteraceae bacterium]
MSGGAGQPFAELIESVAEATAAPAGGSAVAWAGALAAALVEMTAAFAHDSAVTVRARELRTELIVGAERELTAYEPVLSAARLPVEDPSRAELLASALSRASESALAIAHAAAEVAELAAAVAAQSKPALAGDASAGALLAEAVCRAAARMVVINLADCSDDPRVAQAAARAESAAAARTLVTAGL